MIAEMLLALLCVAGIFAIAFIGMAGPGVGGSDGGEPPPPPSEE